MSDKIAYEIANRVKMQRQKLGISLQELANRTNMSKSTLQRYETGGIANIPLHNLEILAYALNITPAYLMGWEKAENKIAEFLAPQEQTLIEKYRSLSPKGQIAADNMIDSLLSIEQNSNEE